MSEKTKQFLAFKDNIAMDCLSKGRNTPRLMCGAFYEYGLRYWDVNSTIRRLVKAGQIIRIGKGVYDTREAVESSIKDIKDRHSTPSLTSPAETP